MRRLTLLAITLVALPCIAQERQLIREHGPVVALTHVEVIDGTGAPPRMDQTVVIEHDRITAVGPAKQVKIPARATVLVATGKTVIPGLVGMHEHLFTVAPIAGTPVGIEQFVSFPQLYLASGVTTARTTGSMDPYGDLAIKRSIDAGKSIGPDIDLTTPYLEGDPPAIPQMYVLKNAEDARALIRYWHSLGFTSAKAYADITADELRASIEEAHRLGMKITGHLCSVGYEQAIEFGIDNLEHGPFQSPDGDLDPQRNPGTCTSAKGGASRSSLRFEIGASVEPDSPELQKLIQLMVQHRVALTSTLAVVEGGVRPNLESMARLKMLLHPVAWARVSELHASQAARAADFDRNLKKEMAFELAFAHAGGLLMAGCDPTGDGHAIAGIGDQRNLELLVEAGFTVPETIRVATLNGATFEGIAARTGSVAVGKTADLVLLDGDLAGDISVIEKPEIVFKSGVGYDSAAIYDGLAGQVGLH